MVSRNGNGPEPDRFELRVRLDATLSIVDPATKEVRDWLKPGTEAACSWPGMPTEAELALRYRALAQVIAVTLEDQIVSAMRTKAGLETGTR